MSQEASPEVKQQRMKEFVSLLPFTLELAGLPKCHPDRLFTNDQLEARVTTVRMAYRVARQMVRDIGDNGV
ncbi:hypothetical protein [Fimbriiglobus ruber]|uniref:Uncharacterized protein n=1 Tax=Fimbriiglobus ruber TaxID=1908690 RepID=A0A225D942_9BACT|nr:hypothetical protein [Fimbriiglobus ruber]OWK35058.1 hypothetical protein FRUB_09900 [Fimbriiglobus ruber]